MSDSANGNPTGLLSVQLQPDPTECANCDHPIERRGNYWTCTVCSGQCTMIGCIPFTGHPLQVTARERRRAQ